MRPRPSNATQTAADLMVEHILEVCGRYPLLHSYGVGLDMFRDLPQQDRMRAIEYSKWMLAFALDSQIDSAYFFFRALHLHRLRANGKEFVKITYLQHMYNTWRKLSGRGDKDLLDGPMIVAALIMRQRVFFTPKSKPKVYIAIYQRRLISIENYLKTSYGFKPWDSSEYKYNLKDERLDEMGNEPQCVDALENEKAEENG